MLPIVAIEVPAEVAPAIADSVKWSCENAIGSGRCPLAQQLTNASDVAWYAIVRGDDDEPSKLRIEFRSHTRDGRMLAQRVLAFSERDLPESRWATAGLVIAGLVAAEDALARSASPARDQPEPVRPVPPSRPRPEWWWGLDAGALTGPGLREGAYRAGAFARAWATAGSGLIGAATLRYAERGGALSLTWWSLSTGVGARFGPRHAALGGELIGDLVFERMLVSAQDPVSARVDRGSQDRFGGRLGLNATVELTRSLQFLAGTDVSALTPAVDIAVNSHLAASEPVVRFAFSAGLRADL
jgi:hypothetical protein